MALQPLQSIFQQMRRIFHPAQTGAVSDARLLERFLKQNDEAAFELLVWRHGPTVLGVCRRLLHNEQDAEDAFQATFFTLARKAGSIGKRDAISSWLYKVAYRIALRVRTRAAKHVVHERPLSDVEPLGSETDPSEELAWRELRPLLDAEVNRLPEKYRAAFILCCLEGKTNEEAAEQLGCPKGTVLSRLSRARERLRLRLTERGLALVVGPLAGMARQLGALVEVSPVLAHATAHAALLLSLGQLLGETVSSTAVALMEEMLQDFWARRLRRAGAILLALAFFGGSTAAVAHNLVPAKPGQTAPLKATPGSPVQSGGCH